MSSEWSDFTREVKSKTGRTGTGCRVGAMLRTLPDDAKKVVTRALKDPALSAAAIHKALKSRLGADAPSLYSIANHRRGACRCDDVR